MNDIEHNTDRYISKCTERNYGIDTLRIVSMLMIVTLHLLGHGIGVLSMESGSLRNNILWFLEITAFCSVNCYALISGFVGVTSKYKFTNLITLWIQVVFYTVSFTILAKIINPDAISLLDILKSFFPVISGQYWFFTSYFILFLFMPLLNSAINNIDKIKMGVLLFLIISFISVFGVIYNTFFEGDTFKINEGYSPWWLIVLYLIGAYISKNNAYVHLNKRWIVIFFVISTLLTWSFKILVSLLGNDKYSDLFVHYTSITVLVSAICLLLLFAHLKINKTLCRIIRFFTPLCFGVYLIHDNAIVRKYIVSEYFGFLDSISVSVMALAIIGCVIGIYLLCSFVDYIRYVIFRLLRIKLRLNSFEFRIKEKIKCSFESKESIQ